MKDEPVTIVDRDVLKVISAETRMDILKILSEGKRTPSFVAKKLKKSDATIVEHLNKLEKAGLVKKLEVSGKKFIFYSLTERGTGIVSSKSRRLVIILTTSLIVLMASFGTFAGHLYMFDTFDLGARSFVATPEEVAGIATNDSEQVSQSAGVLENISTTLTQQPVLLYTSITLLVISLVGFGFYFYKKSKINVMGI